MRSCLKVTGVGILLLAGLAVAGWYKRDEIVDFVSRFGDRTEAPADSAAAADSAAVADPALAERAEAKIIALGQGDEAEITLDADELSGWITGGLAGYFPEYISNVSAAIEEEQVVLNGDVATREVPGIGDLGPIAAFLADTTNVTLRGRLDGLGAGRGIYTIEDVLIGVVPLPESARDGLIRQLKGRANDGLPDNAVVILLPPFVKDIGVRGDRVFMRK